MAFASQSEYVSPSEFASVSASATRSQFGMRSASGRQWEYALPSVCWKGVACS
jgi:hypothetical protein